jgi:hypothetical protein
MRRGLKRTAAGCLIALAVALCLLFFTSYGRTFMALWRKGVVQQYLFPPGSEQYNATTEGNLKAIYTAVMSYHESEGLFPTASGWMDAIQNRIRATNMTPEEAQKKLIRPDLLPPQPGVFGYSMNDAVSGKYKGDIKDPKTVLVFESTDTSRNAHGNPATAKGRYAVTVDGSVVKL